MTTRWWATLLTSAFLLLDSACSGSAGSVVPKAGGASGAKFESDGSEKQKQVMPSSVNSEQLYGGLTAGGGKDDDPALVLEDRIQKLGTLPFQEFVKIVESRVVDNELTLDGVSRVSNVRSRFMVLLPKIRMLAVKWSSYGNFYRMQGINPKVLTPPEIQRAIARAFKYINVPERQANPQIEQQNLQEEIDRINAEAAVGTVSRSLTGNCGNYNQPKCTPDPLIKENMTIDQISFESCKLPSGLELKHRCTMAGAIGGGLMLADKRLETLGAVIAAAALVCVTESTAPVAQFCSPTNTFRQTPSL